MTRIRASRYNSHLATYYSISACTNGHHHVASRFRITEVDYLIHEHVLIFLRVLLIFYFLVVDLGLAVCGPELTAVCLFYCLYSFHLCPVIGWYTDCTRLFRCFPIVGLPTVERCLPV